MAHLVLNQRYEIQHPIGQGGMALVYAAHDRTLDRQVAIKLLKPPYSTDPKYQGLFQAEARAAARLAHPNIVTVYDFGLDQDLLFIVMEQVTGQDLAELLRQEGKLPVDRSLRLIVQACAGLGYAHRAGIVHCDVKPHNLLLTADGRVKVTDFGLARVLAGITAGEQHAVVWGSPPYFSPEQAAGRAPQPASDVYSLGVILFELLTGRLPFLAGTGQEYARLHQKALPPAPSEINPAIPPELDAILFKLLSKDPRQRFRTADQLGRVLQTRFGQLLEPAPIDPTQVQPGEPPAGIEPALTGRPRRSAPSLLEEIKARDWVTIGLALITLAAIGGLLPLWLAVLLQLR